MGKHYVTTPIYYVNGEPHIGHAYTNIATDTLSRFFRLCNGEADVQNPPEDHEKNVFFLTGTDEHGEKVERAAEEAGKTPQEFVDSVHVTFRELWDDLKLSHDKFIRTTDPDHEEAVQYFLQKLYDNNDIEKGTFEGPYCVPCESFWTEDELDDGDCPECGREVEILSEESYFFALTDYVEELRERILNDPELAEDYDETEPSFKIRPKSRRNEVLSQIDSDKLEDLSVTRTRFDWGVPVPFDDDHITYVWFDALINYLTGVGFPHEDWEEWWPADVHVIGKDILRFHAVIWPCMLLALDDAIDEPVQLPGKIQAHGWWTIEGEKISKSRGNAVDPRELTGEYGRDAIRFFLLNEIPFGNDGTMSDEAIRGVINGNLANDLGNLVSRVLGMIEKYRDGIVPKVEPNPAKAKLFKKHAKNCRSNFISAMEKLTFNDATKHLINYVGSINSLIQSDRDDKKFARPWELDDESQELDQVLHELAQSLNHLAYMSYPILPESAEKIWKRLDHEPEQKLAHEMDWYELEGGEEVSKGSALFPRMTT